MSEYNSNLFKNKRLSEQLTEMTNKRIDTLKSLGYKVPDLFTEEEDKPEIKADQIEKKLVEMDDKLNENNKNAGFGIDVKIE
jgi:hypothetical protein